MDTARTDRDTSRWLCRVLVVVGGAVVAAAAAWLFSSATASADTLPQPTDPVATVVGHTLSAVGAPETVATPTVPVALRHAPTQVAVPLRGVTSALGKAVGQLGHHVPPVVSVPTAPIRPTAAPPPVRSTVHHDVHRATVPVAAPHRPVAVTVTHDRPAAPAPVRRPVTPSTPRPAAPWSPMPAPTAPSGSGVGAPGAGGLAPAEYAGAPVVPGLDLIRVVPASTPFGRASAGRGPGSTPD
ncbi:MAG TPA: hypothetical protein VFW65_06040 [Pseudonocardiaceae bacterium]|nr:hypothetical protein [Pseudonocardiaceae bacterium]